MRRLAEDRRGAAVVEFSCMLPVLMLITVGLADVVQIGRGKNRVHSAAAQIGMIVSQCTSVSKGDETQLAAMAKRVLGPFGASGKAWTMTIIADGRDEQNKPFTWTMQHAQSSGTTNNAQDQGSKPDPSRSPFTPAANQVVYRTYIFAPIETSFIARHNPTIKHLLGSNRDGHTYGFSLTVGRPADVGGLRTQNTADRGEDCLKARTS